MRRMVRQRGLAACWAALGRVRGRTLERAHGPGRQDASPVGGNRRRAAPWLLPRRAD